MRGRKVIVTLVAPGERIRDEEGRWSELGTPYTAIGVVAAAAGGYSSRSAPDRDRDSGIVLLPSETPVTTEQVVQITGAGTLPDGEYRVENITRTRKHHRCLMQRHRPGAS